MFKRSRSETGFTDSDQPENRLREQLEATTQHNESIRRQIEITARYNESIRSQIEVTDQYYESIRRQIEITDQYHESIRSQIEITGQYNESIRGQLEEMGLALDAQILLAIRNVTPSAEDMEWLSNSPCDSCQTSNTSYIEASSSEPSTSWRASVASFSSSSDSNNQLGRRL